MKILKKIWYDLQSGQNIDKYLTICLAVVFTILGYFEIANQVKVSSAILVVLALVSISLLQNHNENQNIKKTIDNLNKTEGLSNRFLKNKYEYSEIKNYIFNSNNIYMWGITLESTVSNLDLEIEKMCSSKKGIHLKVLFIKRSGIAPRMTAFRNRYTDEAGVVNSIDKNIQRLKSYAKKYNKSTIQLKEIDYLPPCSILIFESDHQKSYMFVRINHFRTSKKIRPNFILNDFDDKEWFNYFKNQFEKAWDVAEVIDTKSNS